MFSACSQPPFSHVSITLLTPLIASLFCIENLLEGINLQNNFFAGVEFINDKKSHLRKMPNLSHTRLVFLKLLEHNSLLKKCLTAFPIVKQAKKGN